MSYDEGPAPHTETGPTVSTPATALDVSQGTRGTLQLLARRASAAAELAGAHRRMRVLAHPDLAARLTEPPLSYDSPEQWGGYVPPARGPYGRASPPYKIGYGVDDAPNTSSRRAALMELLRRVQQREQEARDVA